MKAKRNNATTIRPLINANFCVITWRRTVRNSRTSHPSNPLPSPDQCRNILWLRAPAIYQVQVYATCYILPATYALVCFLSSKILAAVAYVHGDGRTFVSTRLTRPLKNAKLWLIPINLWRDRPSVHTIHYLEKAPRWVWGRGAVLCSSVSSTSFPWLAALFPAWAAAPRPAWRAASLPSWAIAPPEI